MPTLAEASLLIVLKARDDAQGVMKEHESAINNLGKAAAAAGLAVAAGVAAIGVESIKMAGDFQKQMTLLQTEAGYSANDVKKLNDQVLNLAPSVGKGPEELAMGLYHIASAGIPAASAMDTLTAAAKLSSIGNADMESSTQAVLGVMAAYPEYMGHAMDATSMLNAIVGTGDMRMQQLAKAMATGILPAANTAHLGLIDVGAALATLTDNVTPADEAATRLRMTFALLTHQSGPATDALGAIGIKSGQLGEDMVKPNGLLVAITDLRTHLQSTFGPDAIGQTNKYLDILRKDGPDAADKYAKSVHGAAEVISVAFGGGRTSAAIQTLLGEFDKFSGKYVQLNKGAGDFSHSWEETTKTFSFQMRALQGASDAFMIRLGTFLLPIATQVAKALGEEVPKAAEFLGHALEPLVNAFEQMWGNIKEGLGWIDVLDGGILAFLRTLGATDSQLQAVNGVIQTLGGIVEAVVKVNFFMLKLAITELVAQLKILWGIISFVGDHFNWFAPILALVVAGFIAWHTALMALAIKEAIVGIIEKMVLFSLSGGIMSTVNGIMTASFWALNAALDANPFFLIALAVVALIAVVILIATHFQTFKDVLGSIGNFIKDKFLDVLAWLRTNWPYVLGILLGPFGLLVAFLATHMTQVVQFFRDLPGRVLPAVKDFLGTILGAIWTGVRAIPGIFLNLLIGIPLLWITGTIWIVESVVKMWQAVISAIITWTPKVLSAIGTFLVNLPGYVEGFLSAVIQKFLELGTSLRNWANTAIPALLSAIGAWFEALPGRVGGALSALGGAIANAFSAALAWTGQHLSEWGSAIGAWFQSLPGAIGSWLSSLPGTMLNFGRSLMYAIGDGIRSAWNAVKDALGGAIHSAVGALPGPLQSIAHGLGLAAGGIVKARSGGTVITVGEGGEDEWVIPASKMRALIIQAGNQTSGVSPLPGAIAPGGGGSGGVVIQLMVDRTILGKVVMDEFSRLHRAQSPRLGSAVG
jgi:TP901 family phage tail tape measure protein